MRRVTLALMVLGLLVIGLLAVSGLQVGATAKKGELAFSTENVDLGRVPLDQPAPFRFEMRNVGGKPVKITGKPQITAVEGC